MDQLALRLIEFVSQQNNLLGLTILGASAFLEYVFPPFPGDTITLFGAFLITHRGWSFVGVLLAVIAGSAAGAMLDFWFGTWLKRRQLRHPDKHPEAREKVNRMVARFQRHGEAYIVLNRFLPGIRSLFFVAAGMAGMRARWVFVWALVSAVLWNLLLIAIGSSVGANFAALRTFFATYSRFMWILLGIFAAGWLARYVFRKVRARRGS